MSPKTNDFSIRPLDHSFKGRMLVFEYQTDAVYEPVMDGWKMDVVRRTIPEAVEKRFTDALFSEWLEEPAAFAAFDGEEWMGCVELNYERWNNRMRISNLLVEKSFRRMGVGRKLFETAVSYAKEKGARMLVLETQTCNAPAIAFYLAMGLRLIGLDLYSYTNQDPERNEVRLEMGMPF